MISRQGGLGGGGLGGGGEGDGGGEGEGDGGDGEGGGGEGEGGGDLFSHQKWSPLPCSSHLASVECELPVWQWSSCWHMQPLGQVSSKVPSQSSFTLQTPAG